MKVKKHTNNKNYPCDDSGNILWDGGALTDFLNKKMSGKSSSSGRYGDAPAGGPTYETPNKPKWSKKVQEEAGKVEKDGLKGSACLIKFLPAFNEKKDKKYKSIQELDTDAKLRELIKFVEDQPPEGMTE